MTTHDTRDLCPRCSYTFLKHMHCPNQHCTYHLQVCASCDKLQAAHAVLVDHEEDCLCAPPTAPFVRVDLSVAA